jgi:hypothetical protein
MRRRYLTGVAAIAVAFGMTAAGAQNVESQRDTDTGAQNQPGVQPQNAPAPSGQSRQSEQAPQSGDKQQAAGNEQPDRSGLIALDEQEQMRISDIIRRQRIQPLTNVNFSLSVASTVPSSVRLSPISAELANIFPSYRDFSFFVAKQELVIVDPQSYGIVAFVPISSGGTSTTVGAALPREDSGVGAPREDTGAAGAPPPPPIKKKAARTDRKAWRLHGRQSRGHGARDHTAEPIAHRDRRNRGQLATTRHRRVRRASAPGSSHCHGAPGYGSRDHTPEPVAHGDQRNRGHFATRC